MQPKTLTSFALCVGVLTVTMLALAACGSGSARKEGEANKPRPLPEAGRSLRPGEYSSGKFKPSFTFSVGKSWSTVEPIPPDTFALGRQGETRVLGFTMFIKEVFKPGTQKVVKAPEHLVGWFEHHPYLQTSKPESITVGGIKGKQFDMVVDAPKDYYGECGTACVDLWRLSTGEAAWFYEGDKIHLIILDDVKGDPMEIDISTSASEFDEFLPEAQKVVETIKWGGP